LEPQPLFETLLKSVEFSLIWATTIFLIIRFKKSGREEIKLLLLAFLVLSLKAAYKTVVDYRKLVLALPSPEPYHPIIDHFLETLFFLLAAYAILRPVFLKHREAIDALLWNNLLLFLGATVFIFYDYSSSYVQGMHFGAHWGDIALESYQLLIMLGIIFAMDYVWMRSRASTALLATTAFSLWALSHVFHILNMLLARNLSKTLTLLFKGTEIPAIALLLLAVAVPDERKRSFIEAYAEIGGEAMRREIEELTQIKEKLEEERRKAVETMEEMKRLKEFSEEMVEHVPIGIIRLDSSFRIVYENPKMKEIMGAPEDEKPKAMGKDIRELPSVKGTRLIEALERLRSGEEVSGELPFKSIYGKEAILRYVAVPFFEARSFSGALIMVEDTTEQKQAEERLKNKIQELERWQKLTVDRELRMKELKERIKELEQEVKRLKR